MRILAENDFKRAQNKHFPNREILDRRVSRNEIYRQNRDSCDLAKSSASCHRCRFSLRFQRKEARLKCSLVKKLLAISTVHRLNQMCALKVKLKVHALIEKITNVFISQMIKLSMQHILHEC